RLGRAAGRLCGAVRLQRRDRSGGYGCLRVAALPRGFRSAREVRGGVPGGFGAWHRRTVDLPAMGVWFVLSAITALYAAYSSHCARIPRIRLAIAGTALGEFLRSAFRTVLLLSGSVAGFFGAAGHSRPALRAPPRNAADFTLLPLVRVVLRGQPILLAATRDRFPVPR